MKNNLWLNSVLLASAIACSMNLVADNHNDWLNDDSFFDDQELTIITPEISTGNQSSRWRQIGTKISHTAGWTDLFDDLYHHRTEATVSWSDSLSPALFASADVSAWSDWQHRNLITDTPIDHSTDTNINEFWLQGSSGKMSLKVGKFPIGWGEIEGGRVIDVVNPALDPTTGELTGLGSGQWFAQANRYGDNRQVSGFINLHPAEKFAGNMATPDIEAGLRIKHTGQGTDRSFHLGQFYEDQPVNSLSGLNSDTYQLAGVSVNLAKGNWLLKSDLAYKQGLTIYTTPTSPVEADRIDLGLGTEYNSSEGYQLTTAIIMNYWLEDPNGKGTLLRTNQITPADQFQATGIVMLSDSYLNDNLGVTLAGNGALTGELLLVSAQINYQWTDAWNSSLQYTTISADSSTPFAMMDGISLWYASLSWTN